MRHGGVGRLKPRVWQSPRESNPMLTNHIRSELSSKKGVLLAVFFDVKGAFDSVWHDGLLLKLARAGVTGKMHKWLTDYLRNRGYYVQLGQNRSGTKTTGGRGVPQGSTVSPGLFNGMILNLSPALTSERGIGVSIFADDIAVWDRGSHNPDVYMTKIRKAVACVETWATK